MLDTWGPGLFLIRSTVLPARSHPLVVFGDDMFVASEQEAQHGNDIPRTIVRRKVSSSHHTSTEVDEGEARRIWQHIRRSSRPTEPPHFLNEEYDREAGDENYDLHVEDIRNMALKHGRKISTATLRSLAKDFRKAAERSGLEEGADLMVSGPPRLYLSHVAT